jgi:hypothetical protein
MTLAEIYPKLCEPFPMDLIEIRPGATTRDKARALAMPYADIRVYQQALDDIVGPDHWQVSYRPMGDGAIICQLTIRGVTREDAGELGEDAENRYTSAIAQAFKRACSAFGLGRYLYELPTVWGDYDPDRRSFKDPQAVIEQIYSQAKITQAPLAFAPSAAAKPATEKSKWSSKPVKSSD